LLLFRIWPQRPPLVSFRSCGRNFWFPSRAKRGSAFRTRKSESQFLGQNPPSEWQLGGLLATFSLPTV
jgi:hypothetical protein